MQEDDKYEFSEPTKIQNLVKNYSQFVSFPIYMWLEKSRSVEVCFFPFVLIFCRGLHTLSLGTSIMCLGYVGGFWCRYQFSLLNVMGFSALLGFFLQTVVLSSFASYLYSCALIFASESSLLTVILGFIH